MIATIAKKSASLILTRSYQGLQFNYELLMLRRKLSLSFATNFVFTGGTYNSVHDLNLKKKMQINQILYATVLRQCFQQTGLYISAQPIIETQKIKALNQIKLKYIKQCFKQQKFQFSVDYFLQLENIIGHCKSLLPIIRLITIPELKYRYDTTFFHHHLQPYSYINFAKWVQNDKYLHETDKIIESSYQFDGYRWVTPAQILKQFYKGTIKLAPPQFMICNAMLKFKSYQSFVNKVNSMNNSTSINLAPNVVSLITNNNHVQYPFAGTLIGDCQFPYQRALKTQKEPNLVNQLLKWRKNKGLYPQNGLNRLLFTKSQQFFEQKYSLQNNFSNSFLSLLSNYQETKNYLQNIIE